MSSTSLTTKIGRPSKFTKNIPWRVLKYTATCVKNDEFPTIEQLAAYLGVGTRTIYAWEKEYTDFSQTVEALRDIQRDLLIKNGLTGKYNTSFAVFLLRALHGFTDNKALFQATQNNYMDISPEVLADALKLMKENDSKGRQAKTL